MTAALEADAFSRRLNLLPRPLVCKAGERCEGPSRWAVWEPATLPRAVLTGPPSGTGCDKHPGDPSPQEATVRDAPRLGQWVHMQTRSAHRGKCTPTPFPLRVSQGGTASASGDTHMPTHKPAEPAATPAAAAGPRDPRRAARRPNGAGPGLREPSMSTRGHGTQEVPNKCQRGRTKGPPSRT